ncbi:MAG TPA: leucine-rich repeat domain-containing protein [Chryseosolibacter sp.]|nr:leucine-rich repeat domain-containing protein [Chryseosolibacter sp.]
MCNIFHRIILLFAFGCFASSGWAQFSTDRATRTPIFRSAADSISFSRTRARIDSLKQYREIPQHYWDSLNAKFDELYKTAILDYRISYVPDLRLPNLDSITGDFHEITAVSISGPKKRLPESLFKCTNVTMVELVNTSIKRLPRKLQQLKNLEILEIYHNESGGHLRLRQNKTVKQLVISSKTPEQLPRRYSAFASLEHLDLSQNNLTHFPNGARKNKRLKELTLKNNRLTLEGKIKYHPHVEKLSLQYNNIERVPASIANFPNLIRLSLNYNKITDVDTAIVQLQKLEALSFYKNNLSRIPTPLYYLSSLKGIDLFYNEIESLDSTLSYWKNLEVLYLNHNKLIFLPQNIDKLSRLDALFLAHNRIDRLPLSIGNLRKLKVLKVSHNYLRTLPPSLLDLSDMEDLDIASNYLSDIDPRYFDFKQFKIFSLGNNPWSTETKRILLTKVPELRKRNVFVHVLGENESLDD